MGSIDRSSFPKLFNETRVTCLRDLCAYGDCQRFFFFTLYCSCTARVSKTRRHVTFFLIYCVYIVQLIEKRCALGDKPVFLPARYRRPQQLTCNCDFSQKRVNWHQNVASLFFPDIGANFEPSLSFSFDKWWGSHVAFHSVLFNCLSLVPKRDYTRTDADHAPRR